MRFRSLLILFSGVLLSNSVYAQTRLNFEDFASWKNATTVSVDTARLRGIPLERLVIDRFPCGPSHSKRAFFRPSTSPIDGRTTILLGDTRLPSAHFKVFLGEFENEPASRILLAISDRYIFCSIERKDSSPYVLCPALHASGDHILMNQSELFRSGTARSLTCLNEDEPEFDRRAPMPLPVTLPFRPQSFHSLLECKVAVEADSSFYAAAGGSVDLVTAYVNALFAMSSAIYEDETQITFHIPWLKLWASNDPYNVKGNAYLLPDTVKSYWQSHYSDVKRDVAHVMTSIGYGGGGFGWFAMCGTDYAYSVSSPRTHEPFPTFAFTYDAYIVSHEIGHNFGLPHSHSCYWAPPLDTCYTNDDATLKLGDACYGLPITPRKNPGTIMSYCANANYALSGNNYNEFKLAMTFSPRVADTLRRNAESYTCITQPTDPTVRLLSPRGGTALPGDTTIDVTWTSAHVTNVDLQYSSNGGQTWNSIAQNASASDGSRSWRVPNLGTTTGIVVITDANNASVSDTSLLPISVVERAAVRAEAAPAAIQISHDAILFPRNLHGSDFVVYDLLGNTVMSGSADGLAQLRQLAHGAYVLRLNTNGASRSYRFIH